MDDAPLVGLHRIHHHSLAGAPHTIGEAQCHLLDGLFAPIAVVLDVDDQPAPVDAALVEDQIDNRLEGAKRLAPPADQQPEVIAGNVDHHRVVSFFDEYLRRDSHLVEKLGHHLAGLYSVRFPLRNPNPSLPRGLLQHLDVHVLAGLVEVFQGLLDGLVDSLSGDFDAVAVAAVHAAFPLPMPGGKESDPQPVMKYCWPMLKRLLTTQ